MVWWVGLHVISSNLIYIILFFNKSCDRNSQNKHSPGDLTLSFETKDVLLNDLCTSTHRWSGLYIKCTSEIVVQKLLFNEEKPQFSQDF